MNTSSMLSFVRNMDDLLAHVLAVWVKSFHDWNQMEAGFADDTDILLKIQHPKLMKIQII